MNEYTDRINAVTELASGIILDYASNATRIREALYKIADVLEEMSQDIESLRSKAHSHDDDDY